MSINCLHTGGTIGADQFWEELAKNNGHMIKKYHFDGHKHTRVEVLDPHSHYEQSHYEHVEVISNDTSLCNSELELAANKLGRELPKTGYQRHLLERDWLLVHKSEATSLFAIGHIENGIIQGGTGWICELFHQLMTINKIHIQMFFHCIETNLNYQISDFGWMPIEKLPKPHGNWIGCGSRHI